MNYGYQRTVSMGFDDVDAKIRFVLADIGFGIITEINIKKTFKEKMNLDYPRFRIFGACNPELAEKALNFQPEVAMLMPCNVVFWENDDSSVTVSVVDAAQQLSATGHDDLIQLGKDVDFMLKSAIDTI